MITKITKLINLKHSTEDIQIDPTLLKYLITYTKYKDTSPVSFTKLQNAINSKSEKVKILYDKIKPDHIDDKLIYFLLRLSELRKYKRQKLSTNKIYTESISDDLRKGALGFKVGYFDDFKIHKMKNLFSNHVFEMHYNIYQVANIYVKLKNNNVPVNDVHAYFCDVIMKIIGEYEQTIMEVKVTKCLPYFYAQIWICMNRIKSINLLNECFKDNADNPIKVLEHCKDNIIIKEVVERTIAHYNVLINQLISEGQITDNVTEFFIISNASAYDIWDYYTIDYGKIPYFISKDAVEVILNIGKTVLFLKKISKIDFSYEIDIRSSDLETNLKKILIQVNDALKVHFYDKYNLFECLNYAKQIFLCERADFTSTLYNYLQQHNKINKSFYHKSIVHLLSNTITDTFGTTTHFLSQIDMCILQNEQQLDYVSLFCKLDFPLNTIFTKEIVMKYVSAFRFIWRLKKIEHQLRYLRKRKFDDKSKTVLYGYLNVVTKILTYLFETAIEKEYKLNDCTGVGEIRKTLNIILDKILIGMFQVKGKGNEEIDLFVSSLDSMCLMLGRSDVREVVHNEVKHNLKDFIEKQQHILKGTNLYDLIRFV